MQERKVGTVTLGTGLIVFGILFILHDFFPDLSYNLIFRFWPLVFISLGIEVLLSARREGTMVFSITSVVLLFIILFFAMCMAGADWMMENLPGHIFC